jgi:hypothetical protein
MESSLPEYWRLKAVALRLQAEGAGNQDDADALRRMADRFDQFATTLEGAPHQRPDHPSWRVSGQGDRVSRPATSSLAEVLDFAGRI